MKSRYCTLAAALALAVALTLCAASCAKVSPPATITSEATFAAAPFVNPSQSSEVPAGMLSPESGSVDGAVLAEMDEALASSLSQLTNKIFLPPGRVKECLAKTQRDTSETRGSVRQYWSAVGKCAKADYILVPQAVLYRERVGSPGGADRPAKVILDLYLIDVKTGGLYRHFHYDEEQQALTDNILEIRKFMDRGGKWVTAMDLAREAIRKGVKEMGL
ncbi:MAG: hypothetical protein HQK81_13645 [Desulfovibrionaceae bacterium]|nr:hypothetical protein [Desulfovibrionaceae bacterium]MBF0515087.1 hypothetical protein [Desulfovibrionaceae bacterium]